MNDQQILTAALALPPDLRMAIAEKLYDSLAQTDRHIETAWAEEGELRIDAYQRGEIESVPAEEVLEELLG